MPYRLPAYNVHQCFSTSVIVSYAQSKRNLHHCRHWERKNAVSTHSDASSTKLSLDDDNTSGVGSWVGCSECGEGCMTTLSFPGIQNNTLEELHEGHKQNVIVGCSHPGREQSSTAKKYDKLSDWLMDAMNMENLISANCFRPSPLQMDPRLIYRQGVCRRQAALPSDRKARQLD